MSAASQHPLDRPEVLAVIFHPRRDFSPPDPARDVRVKVSRDVSLGGGLHVAGPDSPLVLFFHGNGEIASDYNDIAPVYNSLGLSFLVVDYRGYGHSDGSPTITNLLSDARAVFDALPDLLNERRLAPSRIYVMGRSLGSASAIEIAAHADDRIAGLIIESGFAYALQLIERLGGPPLLKKDDGTEGTAALAKIAGVTVPTLVIHGETDWIIPVGDAQALHKHAGAKHKRLLTIPGAGHNDLLWVGQKEYFDAVQELTGG